MRQGAEFEASESECAADQVASDVRFDCEEMLLQVASVFDGIVDRGLRCFELQSFGLHLNEGFIHADGPLDCGMRLGAVVSQPEVSGADCAAASSRSFNRNFSWTSRRS